MGTRMMLIRNGSLPVNECPSSRPQQPSLPLKRRTLLTFAPISLIPFCKPAFASQETLRWDGGDLVFPQTFLGRWTVQSTLTNVELPFGTEYADMKVVQRAIQEDLNNTKSYGVYFTTNNQKNVVFDRQRNIAELMKLYMDLDMDSAMSKVKWTSDIPDQLQITLAGNTQISTLVTKRSESIALEKSRLETSEFLQELIENQTEPGGVPKVKASRVYTKYHWRDKVASADGPEIIANQQVMDYLTPYSDPKKFASTGYDKPVAIYHYKIAFFRS